MRISDWSSDVCSSDLRHNGTGQSRRMLLKAGAGAAALASMPALALARTSSATHSHPAQENQTMGTITTTDDTTIFYKRSEEHTSELQSLMRISYAVFCLKKKKKTKNITKTDRTKDTA